MNRDDSRLLRHLTTAVAVKLALLAVLWWAFVRDGAVDAGSGQTAAHIELAKRNIRVASALGLASVLCVIVHGDESGGTVACTWHITRGARPLG